MTSLSSYKVMLVLVLWLVIADEISGRTSFGTRCILTSIELSATQNSFKFVSIDCGVVLSCSRCIPIPHILE
jgi:hypothetical protein